MSRPNRYLAWLSRPEQSAPWPYRPLEWQAAWDAVYLGYQDQCRLLRAGAGVEVFEAWHEAEKQLALLGHWIDFCSALVSEATLPDHAQVFALFQRQNRARQRNRHQFRDMLTRMARRRSLDDDTRTRIRAVRDALVRHVPTSVEITEPALVRQEQRFLAAHPGIEFPSVRHLQGLSHAEKAQSRTLARERGAEGVVVERSGQVIERAIHTCEHRQVREALWVMRQESSLANDRSARRLFEARQSMAKKAGFASYAHHELDARLMTSPKTLLAAFETSLHQSAPLYNELDTWLDRYASENLGIADRQAWDMRYILNSVADDMAGAFPEADFPWDATLMKAVPEMLGITGWKVRAFARKGRHASTVFHWEITRNGVNSHIWVAPFQGAGVKNLRVEGDADFFRAGPDQTFHGFIRLYQNHRKSGFGYNALLTLAHELGHVMHWLSLPAAAGETNGPIDLLEVPSVLLEYYPQDPRVLRRWASQRHSLAFWEKHASREDLLYMRSSFTQNLSAWIDLSVNTDPPPSLKKLIASLPERFGIRGVHPADRTWMGYAMWLGYGTFDYMYHLSHSVCHRLHPEIGVRPDAARIARQFRRLEERVLCRTHLSFRVIKQAWKEMAGETLLQSLQRGARTQNRAWRAHLHQLALPGKA